MKTFETNLINFFENNKGKLSLNIKIKILEIYKKHHAELIKKIQFGVEAQIGYCAAVFEGISSMGVQEDIIAYSIFFTLFFEDPHYGIFLEMIGGDLMIMIPKEVTI